MKSRGPTARESWRALFAFFAKTRPQRDRVLERLGLTPNDARALSELDPRDGKMMRTLAAAWGTDASNATWVVDRLEERGLVRRESAPRDRRVTLVRLTAKGARVKAALARGMEEPPPELEQLDAAELKALHAIAVKLLGAAKRAG